MNRAEFIELVEKGPLLLDGAMGSNLILAGMPRGVCSEQWALEHPQVVEDLQRAYMEAGSQAVYAPTFMANRISMENMGLADQVEHFNREIPKISRRAVGDRILVAGDMTTCGKMLEPKGPVSYNDLFYAYAQQVRYLAEAGVDFIIAETLLYEEEALVLLDAAASVTDLAVCCSFTVEADGTLPFGGNVIDAVVNAEAMGAAAAGINCSMGPDQALAVVTNMSERLTIPVIAKLNAGMPEISETGEAVYSMNEEKFAYYMEKLLRAGASVVGGCCGTTPAYIAKLHEVVKKFSR
ncbi:MAG: homocysteine S-methyltransferase family protein [Lachnospiraceae bacterium]|nr:homocysteine S-methyltransferase family protein [Lachnospiraceae bacterium]